MWNKRILLYFSLNKYTTRFKKNKETEIKFIHTNITNQL